MQKGSVGCCHPMGDCFSGRFGALNSSLMQLLCIVVISQSHSRQTIGPRNFSLRHLLYRSSQTTEEPEDCSSIYSYSSLSYRSQDQCPPPLHTLSRSSSNTIAQSGSWVPGGCLLAQNGSLEIHCLFPFFLQLGAGRAGTGLQNKTHRHMSLCESSHFRW